MTSNLLHQFTHIGRNLDPRFVYHRYLLIVAVVAGALHGARALFTVGGLLPAWMAGVAGGLSVALAWILTRELDPDHHPAALVAGGVAVFFPLIWGYLLPLVALVMITRLANRSVGLPLRWTDTVSVLALLILAAALGWWPVALTGLIAFGLDAVMVEPLPRHRWVPLVLVAVLVPTTASASFSWGISGAGAFVVLLIVIAFGWYSLSRTAVSTLADNGSPLYLERVQAGMFLALVTGVLLLIGRGNAALVGLAPLWAAMLGPVVWYAWRMVYQ